MGYGEALEREKAIQGNRFEKAVLEELRVIREHIIELKKIVKGSK